LKAKETIAAIETPHDRVAVSNISAGMIHAAGNYQQFPIEAVGGCKLKRLTKRPHTRKTEVEKPSGHDETPVSRLVVRLRRKLGEQSRADDEGQAHG
jgi:hypothetical protein